MAMRYDVIIERDHVIHADFSFKGQKNVKSEKFSLELQVFFTKYSCFFPFNILAIEIAFFLRIT